MGTSALPFVVTIIFLSLSLGLPSAISDIDISGDVQPKFLVELLTRGNKTYYAEILSSLTWVDARAYCRDLDMTMAEFPDAETRVAVSDKLVELGVTVETYWINANNYPSGVEYFWRCSDQFAFNATSSTLYAGAMRVQNNEGTFLGAAPTTLYKVLCQKVKRECQIS